MNGIRGSSGKSPYRSKGLSTLREQQTALSESCGERYSRGRGPVVGAWIGRGVNDNKGVAGVVEREAARMAGTRPRGEELIAACESCSSSTTMARLAWEKAFPRDEFRDPVQFLAVV
jgi:hypothetical protein